MDFNPLVLRVAQCRADVDALSTTVERALLLLRHAEAALATAEAELQHAIETSGREARLPTTIAPRPLSLPEKIVALFRARAGPLRTAEIATLIGEPNGPMLYQALRRLSRAGVFVRRVASGVYERPTDERIDEQANGHGKM